MLLSQYGVETSMPDITSIFHNNGFVIVPDVLDKNLLRRIVNRCESDVSNEIGTRNLLNFDWARELADKLKRNPNISAILGDNSKLVQCNYFSKNLKNNWYVTLHRDLSIPISEKISSDQWSGWSIKEGQLYAQPPRSVLKSLTAIRLHFEDNDENNGALQVVAGSHRNNHYEKNSGLTVCNAKAGDALLISPLLLHKSLKLKRGTRRVLHYVFGPHSLPNGALWPQNEGSRVY